MATVAKEREQEGGQAGDINIAVQQDSVGKNDNVCIYDRELRVRAAEALGVHSISFVQEAVVWHLNQ